VKRRDVEGQGGGALLDLSQVTLCAAACVNVAATLRALRHCMAQVRFGEALFFTHACDLDLPEGLRSVQIEPLRSVEDYSRFMLHDLHRWIGTSHCLVVQWDGFVINPSAWEPGFLDTDYIGAPWPQFLDGRNVGNGGFSLRSRRLLDACRSPAFMYEGEAEDLAICRTNRKLLESSFGVRFADRVLAERFSFERDRPELTSFGFHGVFNLIEAVGPEVFWDTYRELDDRTTIHADLWSILRSVLHRPHGTIRTARMLYDYLFRR
jgi:hypothetical protein